MFFHKHQQEEVKSKSEKETLSLSDIVGLKTQHTTTQLWPIFLSFSPFLFICVCMLFRKQTEHYIHLDKQNLTCHYGWRNKNQKLLFETLPSTHGGSWG